MRLVFYSQNNSKCEVFKTVLVLFIKYKNMLRKQFGFQNRMGVHFFQELVPLTRSRALFGYLSLFRAYILF